MFFVVFLLLRISPVKSAVATRRVCARKSNVGRKHTRRKRLKTDSATQRTHGFYLMYQYVQDKKYIGEAGHYSQCTQLRLWSVVFEWGE